MQSVETRLLQDAFEEFVKASDSLSNHYVVLENRIAELNREISEKNQELEKARQYLSNILNSLPVGVVVKDGETTIFTNSEAEKFGYAEFSENIYREASRMGEVVSGNGCFKWKKSSLSNGSTGKEILVIEDVSEIQKMKERSERDERLMAMGEMAARIAHEIKNPLGSMQLFLSMIVRGNVGQQELEYLHSVIFGINTIDRIINNLLTYTRPKTIVLRHQRLSRVVKETLDFMSVSIGGRAIVTEFKSTYDTESWFDPDLVKLSFMNFISNAIQAIEDSGTLSVDVKDAGQYVSVLFSDTGMGMSDVTKKNIFNPFFTTKDKGVGLGLFIAHNIVKAHDGYIEVESVEGKGSCFSIYLPKEKS